MDKRPFTLADVERIRADLQIARSSYYEERGRGLIDNYDDVENLCILAEAALRADAPMHAITRRLGGCTIVEAFDRLTKATQQNREHRKGHLMGDIGPVDIAKFIASHTVDLASYLDTPADSGVQRRHLANIVLIALHLAIRLNISLFDLATEMLDRLDTQLLADETEPPS
jgi:hypothetical protein